MLLTPALGWAQTYVTFDVPGATGTAGVSINSAGAVTGYYYDPQTHGFLRSPNSEITTFDESGAASTCPFGINDSGAITGQYLDAANNSHGFVRAANGVITPFDIPNSSQTYPYSINNEGTITGIYYAGTGGNTAIFGFLRYPSGAIATFPGGDFASINAAGTIAGSFLTGGQIQGLLRSRNGVITPYSVGGSIATYSSCINFSGAVAGVYTDGSFINHGFVRSPDGAITSFDPPGAINPSSNGMGIDFSGAIAGSYYDQNQRWHGFLRHPQGQIISFDPPGSTATDTSGMNPYGFIVGNYTDEAGAVHGFIREP